MMRQVLERRFGRALKEDPNNLTGSWPDLVIIDGGAGQLSATEEVFAGLGNEDVPFVAIAKVPRRGPGAIFYARAGAVLSGTERPGTVLPPEA